MSADTTPDSSSAGTETDHLFPMTEGNGASRETIDNPSVDKDSTDTPDTLTLARLDRENQGTWEAEYSYDGEADLHRHYDGCTKNPGHKNFIPVDNFCMEDLPEQYRSNNMMDYIRAVSDLTVRVTSKYVSDKRPKTVGLSDKPFPGYFYRGQWRTTVGTGWVERVDLGRWLLNETCKCKDCLASSKPHLKFARIHIRTSGHVVCDESEAEHATCHLYFDRGGTPETCECVVALTGMSSYFGDIVTDQYKMYHDTHDLDLAHRLHQICKKRDYLLNKLRGKKPNTCKFKWIQPEPEKQPLLFIVSHPHGCSKQISLGRCHSVLQQPDIKCDLTYTTATCPGSSGAQVHVLDMCGLFFLQFPMSILTPVHRGVCDKQPEMNLALINPDWVFPETVSWDLLGRDEESDDVIYGAENEDLRRNYDTCQKNPGHQNFFPVDKFSVDHLPPCECKAEIMELIKVLSELTVRVSVKYVREERLETTPDTDIPYSRYINRPSNPLRLGSGRVTEVEFPDNRAPTEPEFAYIYIRTAFHLVRHNLEEVQTTCHLFFDSGETPGACKDVVTLTNELHTEGDSDLDSSTLVYYTHDLGLAHKLEKFLQLYNNLKHQCYSSYNHEIVNQNGRRNLTPYPPLNIMVSHPHGCAKHVSISYPICHGNTDTEEIQHPYKSIMCRGSSGAPFIALGTQECYPCSE